MKAKSRFFQFFVLFTVIFNTVSAQNFITANGNNTADPNNKFMYSIPPEWTHWYSTGDVQAGITPISTCDANCLQKRSKAGSEQVQKTLLNVVVWSNDNSHGLSKDPITTKERYDAALVVFEASLEPAQVEFLDSFTEMALVEKAAGVFDYSFLKHGPGIVPCFVSKQNGKYYPAGDRRCGQTFGKDAVLAIVNGRARIVTNTPTPPTPPTPPIANNGNTGTGNGTGNGNISIPTAAAGSVNLYIIAGNGNGNPVVTSTGGTGGTGGSVGNTTSTSTGGGTPTGTSGTTTGTTGGMFGTFIPGSGVTSTTTPPGGASATTSTTNTSVDMSETNRLLKTNNGIGGANLGFNILNTGWNVGTGIYQLVKSGGTSIGGNVITGGLARNGG